jgi:hypothetical protein
MRKEDEIEKSKPASRLPLAFTDAHADKVHRVMGPDLAGDATRNQERIGFVLGGQPELHIFEDAGEWEVWLNTGVSDFDGLCIAAEADRAKALGEAQRVLEWMAERCEDLIIGRPTPA